MKSIAIIGAANLDISVCPATVQVFENRTQPVDEIAIGYGGDALNEAAVLGMLGADVHLYTVLGNDEKAALIEEYAKSHHIQLHAKYKDCLTSINIVLVEPDGQRCFYTVKNSSMRQLAREDIPEIKEDIICLASLFVSHALPYQDVIALCQHWKEQNKIICMDTTTAKHGETLEDLKSLLPLVDVFFTNAREAQSLTRNPDVIKNLEAFQAHGANTVIIKMGEEGAAVLHEGKIRKVPVVPNPACIDTTGCGDSFAAGFLWGLLSDCSFEQCLRIAQDCGSLACTSLGSAKAFENEDKIQHLKDSWHPDI